MIPETHDQVGAALINAVEAMRQKNKANAFFWASKAARLAPNLEEPWLIMAAVSNPRARLQYLNQALQINPQSHRAKQGLIWALKQLEPPSQSVDQTIKIQTAPPAVSVPVPAIERTQPVQLQSPPPAPKPVKKRGNLLLFWVTLFLFFCIGAGTVSAFATGWILTGSPSPTSQPQKILVQYYQTPTATPTIPLAQTSTPLPTQTPTSLPSVTATAISLPTTFIPTVPANVAVISVATLAPQSVQISQEEPTSLYTPKNGERWIDVNLSQQKLYAYQGADLVNSFLISSGVAANPTVTGQYRIYVKFRFDDMHGPGYFLPNVPYVLYFHEGYGIHGTYWHNNFGTPMSHGCVNMSIPDAAWVYDWASIGTPVNIHY